MSQRGFVNLSLIVVGVFLLIAGVVIFKSQTNQYPSASPLPTVQISPEPSPTATPSTKSGVVNKTTPTPEMCNAAKDVCFDNETPTVTIQEGYMEDDNHWISSQLVLVGRGSGGYEVKLNGFPKEFTVRIQDQNFPDGGEEAVLIRAQKNVAAKGSHIGTISVRSLITNVTTTVDLTINYVDWDTKAIHTNPDRVTLDCTVKKNINSVNSRELDCGKYDDHFLKFYYFKNDKTIEIRTNVEDNAKRRIKLDTQYAHSTTLEGGQDVYVLHYDPVYGPSGFDSSNLNSEVDGTYKGYFSFVNQATQKEIIHIPYTLTVHAYRP